MNFFFGSVITGCGSGIISIFVEESFPEDLPKNILKQELAKFNVRSIGSMSVEEMRDKYCALKMPQMEVRRQELKKEVEKSDQEAKKHSCKVCGVEGGVKKASEALIHFKLGEGEDEYYHVACAKDNDIIMSSTDARSYIGPTLFKKKENTEELPEVCGGYCSYGAIRFFRVEDLDNVLKAEGKDVNHAKRIRSQIKKEKKATQLHKKRRTRY